MISEILPTLSCQRLELMCCTGGEGTRRGCKAQPGQTQFYNQGRFASTKCKICVGLPLFFFLAEVLFFCKGDHVGRCKEVFSSLPNKLKFTQVVSELIGLVFFFSLSLWYLFFKHSLPSRVVCSSLSVKYREGTSNCGFPEGVKTHKMHAGLRSVSWKCQLSPLEEAGASGTSWITLPKAVYLRFSNSAWRRGETWLKRYLSPLSFNSTSRVIQHLQHCWKAPVHVCKEGHAEVTEHCCT